MSTQYYTADMLIEEQSLWPVPYTCSIGFQKLADSSYWGEKSLDLDIEVYLAFSKAHTLIIVSGHDVSGSKKQTIYRIISSVLCRDYQSFCPHNSQFDPFRKPCMDITIQKPIIHSVIDVQWIKSLMKAEQNRLSLMR